MTPFLALVATGYAVFMIGLGAAWVRDCVHEAQLKKQASR
jgi:hypothetical protein